MNPKSCLTPNKLHELMETARAAPPGDLVEVGVYQGGSAVALAQVAREQGRKLHLFDTFKGIPHAGPDDHHKVGDFADTQLADVMRAVPEADYYVGVFPQTMPAMIGPIALAHIDCDQYASVKACCEVLGPRMARDGVMVFDDYDVLIGAKRAVDEAFAGRIEMSAEGKARVRF